MFYNYFTFDVFCTQMMAFLRFPEGPQSANIGIFQEKEPK